MKIKTCHSQELANILNISQAKLSNIENEQTKKIDFLLIDKVCIYFDKDFDFFTENTQPINNIEKLDGSINNHGTINLFPENIIDQIKKLVEENNFLKEENRKLKS